MTGKFVLRTLRAVMVPGRPYFAHLAITHRCNLRCRFCHGTETRFIELDTEGTKRVIDALGQLGVGVVSISGGASCCFATTSTRSLTMPAPRASM